MVSSKKPNLILWTSAAAAVTTVILLTTGCTSAPLGADESNRIDYARNPAGLNPPISTDDNSLQWPSTLYRDTERKFNNESNPVKGSNLSGVSWVHIGEMEVDEFHYVDSGIKDEEGSQSLMTFEGKDSALKATIGESDDRHRTSINDRGTATVERKDGIILECRLLPRTKVPQLLCRETGSAAGTRYLLFKQSTFLRKLTSTSDN